MMKHNKAIRTEIEIIYYVSEVGEDSESYPLKFAINERSRIYVHQRRTDA